MDFYQGKETLTAIEWILRAIIAFIFLVIIGRILGQRTISQLRLMDFVIALMIGNIVAHPLSDEKLGLKGSMLTTLVLAVLYLGGTKLMLKWQWFQKIINKEPIVIVQNGEIVYKGLKKARISIDVLLEELRGKQVENIKKVALAVWEPNGNMSVFLEPLYVPLTQASLQMTTASFDLPKTIIRDGHICEKELKIHGKNEDWLTDNLKSLYQAEVKDILLATIDNKDNLTIFYYR
ncbi:DUF421 domain-containing protein [Niallia sp. FSL R7-0271]|uniref:DUF421 domain-containing protein n=1 Tax=Niallia sp. FSL R7-0271 TaxID=2921678 RepID=UPI0030FA6BB2